MEKITQETLEKELEEKKERELSNFTLSEEEKKIVDEAIKADQHGSVLKDEDIQVKKNGLDIRQLKKCNKEQLDYEAQLLQVAYLRTIHEDNEDIVRLLLIVCKQLGVKDIKAALEEIILEANNIVR